MRRRSAFIVVAPLTAVISLSLAACSFSPTAGGTASSSSSAASTSGPTPSAAAPVASGTVSTEGVCGLVPIATVNSILGRTYVNSQLVAVPASTMADTNYCAYTPASGAGAFQIQVATSDPTDATSTFNDATGGKLVPTSGIGDSALFSDFFPELVVVWGQTTIAVGQSTSGTGDSPITQDQLKKLATAVHAAG